MIVRRCPDFTVIKSIPHALSVTLSDIRFTPLWCHSQFIHYVSVFFFILFTKAVNNSFRICPNEQTMFDGFFTQVDFNERNLVYVTFAVMKSVYVSDIHSPFDY